MSRSVRPRPRPYSPLDTPPAVHHALQERLENELRTSLRIVEAAQPVLGVLAKERLDGAEQLLDVQATIGIYVPEGVLDPVAPEQPT